MTRQASETSNTRISRLAAALPGALDDLAVLTLEGADAETFAQAQFASDLATLSPGRWQWTCLLSAQGRVLGFGPLLRPEPGRLLWMVPATRADDLAASLRRYILRRRLAIARAPLPLVGSVDAATSGLPLAGGDLHAAAGELRLELGGVGGRALRVGGEAAPSPDACAAWRAFDVLDALPRIEDAAVDAWTAHALGLQRVEAFSTGKGCYPGQEIVARTHFLGRNKRHPRRGWLARAPAPGTRLLAGGDADAADAMGEVVCCAAIADGGALVLAVVREDAPVELRMAGTDAVGAFEPPPPLALAGQK